LNLRKAFTAVLLILAGAVLVCVIQSGGSLKAGLERLAAELENVLTGSPEEPAGSEAPQPEPEPSETPAVETAAEESLPPFPSDVELPERTQAPQENPGLTVKPTTIKGGMSVRNDTELQVDLQGLLLAGPSQKLAKTGIQILIIHTHGSEAYTSDDFNSYTPSDTFRTEDKAYSVIRVGDELAACLESYGLEVIHDREIYDYPSYTGSYSRSAAAIEAYLTQYPEISIVLDVHRDAIGSGDVVYKTVAESSGTPSSQLMLLVGTGQNGLSHPYWQENLRLALYLQSAVVDKYPTLARPVALKNERYNQQMTTGSLILEVGSSGNTLSEALQAVRMFSEAVGPALLELVEQ